jgi:hypothetical protein
MKQRSICLFLAVKRVSAQAIHSELLAVLGLDAIAASRVTKYLRQKQFPVIPCQPSDEPSTIIIDNGILDALAKQPLSSIPRLTKTHMHFNDGDPLASYKITWVCHEAS